MIVPIALAAGLGLAACGGDDKDSDTLSRSDLATKADMAEDLQKLPEVGKDVGAAADKIGAKNCAQ